MFFHIGIFCFLSFRSPVRSDSFCCFVRKKQENSGRVRGLFSGPPRRIVLPERIRPRRSYHASYRFQSNFAAQTQKSGGTPDTYRRNALFAFLVVLRDHARDLLLGLHDLVVEALGRNAHRAVAEDDELL